jgi:hypothetical protein
MQCNIEIGNYLIFFSALHQYPDHNPLSVMGPLRDSRKTMVLPISSSIPCIPISLPSRLSYSWFFYNNMYSNCWMNATISNICITLCFYHPIKIKKRQCLEIVLCSSSNRKQAIHRPRNYRKLLFTHVIGLKNTSKIPKYPFGS